VDSQNSYLCGDGEGAVNSYMHKQHSKKVLKENRFTQILPPPFSFSLQYKLIQTSI